MHNYKKHLIHSGCLAEEAIVPHGVGRLFAGFITLLKIIVYVRMLGYYPGLFFIRFVWNFI